MSDVIKLLEHDHKVVEGLFSEAEANEGDVKIGIVKKICAELKLHASVEETIVYPAMDEAGLDEEVSHSVVEHQGIKDAVAALEGDPADPMLLASLKNEVTHHVGEEESEIFPHFRSLVDQARLDELGARVELAKAAAKG